MKDFIFYIHGVTPERNPAPHKAIYKRLHQGIKACNDQWPDAFDGAEWGWNPGEHTPRDQELLSQAQNQLGQRVLPAITQARDFSINPARLALNQLREINFYGFSDMFYYTSETGKEAIRSAVCQQLMSTVTQLKEQHPDSPLRMTLVGHSAGCVIALDLLFHLFHPETAPFEHYTFLDHTAQPEAQCLRGMVQDGTIKLRRMFTLGNPLAAMAFRHSRVVESIAAGEKLDPEHYGLTPDPDLPGPRWINIWDRDDPLAWPVEPLFSSQKGTVKDKYVNVSDWITKAHSAYWDSKPVQKTIADIW